MPPQAQPTKQPTKLNPPFFIWILIIISLLAGAFEIYQGQQNSRSSCSQQNSNTVLPVEGKCPAGYTAVPLLCGPNSIRCDKDVTKDQFAGWKTYRNEEYGFEMEIPEDWRTDVHNDAIHLFYSTTGEKEAKEREDECVKNLVNADSSVCANPYAQDLSFFSTNPESSFSPRNDKGKVSLNGFVWNKYESGADLYYELNIGDKGYTFYGKTEAILNSVLSTFKFIR